MASPRKHWLDWERGLAVLFMVEVHALDAWLDPGAAHGAIHDALRFLGGFAAPSFLFMAGLSQALGDASLERRGAPAPARRWKALSRALWLLGVAYGFRLAEYVLGGMYRVAGGWQDILRVDILNVIAISLAVCGLLVPSLPRRSYALLVGLSAGAIVLTTPIVAAWQHPLSRLLDYFYASYPRANFSLFSWAAFLLAGSAIGRLTLDRDRPALLLAAGIALVALGYAADRLPPFYAHQDFWRTSPSWFTMRLGCVIALTGTLQLLPASFDRGLSWLRTMGRHSLLGYLASIELTYGHATAPLHRALLLPSMLAAIAAMIAATWALSAAADWLAIGRRRAAPAAASPTIPPT